MVDVKKPAKRFTIIYYATCDAFPFKANLQFCLRPFEIKI